MVKEDTKKGTPVSPELPKVTKPKVTKEPVQEKLNLPPIPPTTPSPATQTTPTKRSIKIDLPSTTIEEEEPLDDDTFVDQISVVLPQTMGAQNLRNDIEKKLQDVRTIEAILKIGKKQGLLTETEKEKLVTGTYELVKKTNKMMSLARKAGLPIDTIAKPLTKRINNIIARVEPYSPGFTNIINNNIGKEF